VKTLLSHLTGNANVNAAALGFKDAGLLSEFYVTVAAFPGSVLDRIGKVNAFSAIRRRLFDPSLKPFIRTWPWLEYGRIIAPKAGFAKLSEKESAPFFVDTVIQSLDRRVASRLHGAANRGVRAIYGYEDQAVLSFREAKRIGLQCLYDLPIGYWRSAHRLLEIEKTRWPEWTATIPGLYDPEKKLLRKDEELRLADHVFVASSFTAQTLKEFPGKLAPITVIPYGFPPVNDERIYNNKRGFKPLKLLFTGSLTQRKGIADLFAAVSAFGRHVELTIVGSKINNDCPALDNALNKHQWIPSLHHQQVLELMRSHDVLVFPSLFEGFGLVITEAMSQGTPVITTDRTAGPDLINHGENGWLIEAGSTDALKKAIADLLDHPQRITDAGKAAMQTAHKRPWEKYGQELAKAVAAFI
jgi:glycosyltransferase involved in cell wall biosynthesis